MEMYADTDARGGILEPEGVVEIKFRMKDLLKSMYRLDGELQRLRAQLAEAQQPQDKARIEKAMTEREQFLRPLYQQIAIHFADLHDTPERMLEKGVIQDIVVWKHARTTLYWRLRRLLLEDTVTKEILKVRPTLSYGQCKVMMRRWFVEDGGAMDIWEDNRKVVEWLTNQTLNESSGRSVVQENIQALRRDAVINQANIILKEYPDFAIESVVRLLQHMNPQQRSEAIRAISKIEDEMPSMPNDRQDS